MLCGVGGLGYVSEAFASEGPIDVCFLNLGLKKIMINIYAGMDCGDLAMQIKDSSTCRTPEGFFLSLKLSRHTIDLIPQRMSCS